VRCHRLEIGAAGTGAGTSPVKQPTQIRYAAAALSLAAALIHAWAIPQHFGEWWGYGAFFLVVAVAQVYLSDGLLYRPQRSLFVLGIAGNLVVVGLYVATRTIGIPFFGPHAGEVEDMEVIDPASVVAEAALVAALALLLRVPASRQSPSGNRRDGVSSGGG
jgi:uncharacterized membrane protein YhhN